MVNALETFFSFFAYPLLAISKHVTCFRGNSYMRVRGYN